jgi:hypothetical protein
MKHYAYHRAAAGAVEVLTLQLNTDLRRLYRCVQRCTCTVSNSTCLVTVLAPLVTANYCLF